MSVSQCFMVKIVFNSFSLILIVLRWLYVCIHKIHTYIHTNTCWHTHKRAPTNTHIYSGYCCSRNIRGYYNSYTRIMIFFEKNNSDQKIYQRNMQIFIRLYNTYGPTPQLIYPLSLQLLSISYVISIIMSSRKFWGSTKVYKPKTFWMGSKVIYFLFKWIFMLKVYCVQERPGNSGRLDSSSSSLPFNC